MIAVLDDVLGQQWSGSGSGCSGEHVQYPCRAYLDLIDGHAIIDPIQPFLALCIRLSQRRGGSAQHGGCDINSPVLVAASDVSQLHDNTLQMLWGHAKSNMGCVFNVKLLHIVCERIRLDNLCRQRRVFIKVIGVFPVNNRDGYLPKTSLLCCCGTTACTLLIPLQNGLLQCGLSDAMNL